MLASSLTPPALSRSSTRTARVATVSTEEVGELASGRVVALIPAGESRPDGR